MMNDRFHFAEFVCGGWWNRGNVVNIDECVVGSNRIDCAKSVFVFDEDYSAYSTQNNNSIKGYIGKHTFIWLAIDFDGYEDGSNLEDVKTTVIQFCRFLEVKYEVPIESFELHYSGAKGFHLAIPSKLFGYITPSIHCSSTVIELVKELTQGFAFVDFSIYSTTDLLRLPHSINSKTKLFKIPLTFNELITLSTDQIRNVAKNDRDVSYLAIEEVLPNSQLVELYAECSKKVEESFDSKEEVTGLSYPQQVSLNHKINHVDDSVFNKRIKKQLSRLKSAKNHERNNTLYSVATECKKIMIEENIETDWIVPDLVNIAESIQLQDSEIMPTILSGFQKGESEAAKAKDVGLVIQTHYSSYPNKIRELIGRGNFSFSINGVEQNDSANADIFVTCFGAFVLYDHSSKKWFYRHGSIWHPDDSEIVKTLARVSVEIRQLKAQFLSESDYKDKLLSYCSRSKNDTNLVNLLKGAQSRLGLMNNSVGWTDEPFMLPARNGIIDLQSGICREASMNELYHLHVAEDYLSDANYDELENAKNEILLGDIDFINYFEQCIGYSISGDCSEQVAFYCVGVGGNGKDTILEPVVEALGTFAIGSSISTFEKGFGKGNPTFLSMLEGKRFILIDEISENTVFDLDLVKKWIGANYMTGKRNYADPNSFVPKGKLWFTANKLPRIPDKSEGTWRRVIVLPFLKKFEGINRDRGLKDRIKANKAGTLAWLVKCSLKYHANKHLGSFLDRMPQIVHEATEGYKIDSDPLNAFLDDCCEINADHKERASNMHLKYAEWVKNTNPDFNSRLTRNQFSAAIEQRFTKTRTNAGIFYLGLRLL